MKPASFTYQAAQAALGLPSDKRLRKAVKNRILKVTRLGHRTLLIPRQQLEKWARNRNLVLVD
jgi:hypothetical protein